MEASLSFFSLQNFFTLSTQPVVSFNNIYLVPHIFCSACSVSFNQKTLKKMGCVCILLFNRIGSCTHLYYFLYGTKIDKNFSQYFIHHEEEKKSRYLSIAIINLFLGLVSSPTVLKCRRKFYSAYTQVISYGGIFYDCHCIWNIICKSKC